MEHWMWAIIGAVLLAVSLFMAGVIGRGIRLGESNGKPDRPTDLPIDHDERLNGRD